jgi:hypothetical protein
VPFAASRDSVFSVSYGEIRRSKMIFQRQECGLVELSALPKFDINFINTHPFLIETSVYILTFYRYIVIQGTSK